MRSLPYVILATVIGYCWYRKLDRHFKQSLTDKPVRPNPNEFVIDEESYNKIRKEYEAFADQIDFNDDNWYDKFIEKVP